jgi:hypothetical protein
MRHDQAHVLIRKQGGRIEVASSSGAIISPCQKYRYLLWRVWNSDDPVVNLVGLNPSTADETKDDPTMRRCRQFARAWGFGGFLMTNLFAFRATRPSELRAVATPVGPENDSWIVCAARSAERVVAVWGVHGTLLDRDKQVMALLQRRAYCIVVTKSGHPGHPLYLRKDLPLIEFPFAERNM